MLHTKFRGNRPAGSREDFEGFYHIWAWRPSWSCDQHHVIKFSFLYLKAFIQNLVQNSTVVSEKMFFEEMTLTFNTAILVM